MRPDAQERRAERAQTSMARLHEVKSVEKLTQEEATAGSERGGGP